LEVFLSASLYPQALDGLIEPTETNIKRFLDNLYSKFMPLEQARWNQSNIDTLFYAGAQTYVNRYYNFSPNTSYQQYYFNLVQQPINMLTGLQRQNRKAISYEASEGADPLTTDQQTKLITLVNNKNGILEQFSRACEQSAIAGMVMAQPYLDYTGDDPAQGELKLKVWEYNSFLVDPYFRNSDMSDCQYVWFQEYISKEEAVERFPDKAERIRPMSGTPQRYGSFYFLPENYNMARNDLMVLSYVWYQAKRPRKRLYSKSRNQFFDFSEKNTDLQILLQTIPDLEVVEVNVRTWNLCTVLNDVLVFKGPNPLGFDTPPCVPIFWNYDPHVNYQDLRVRSLIRTMRDPQFLFNYKVITNNDIAAATINAGWKRKVGAVANEDNLKKGGQGYDIIVNDGYELTDVEKIIPSAVPESDLALAQQMSDLIFKTSGIDLENWSGQQDKQISSLTAMIKQAANVMVFQKYFDQWDYALKLIGDIEMKIVQHNWTAEKVSLYLNEEPSPHFYSGIFSKYNVVVQEADLTPTQQNRQAQQMLEINQAFGREVFTPSQIVPKLNITGKAEIIDLLKSQEEQMQIMQREQSDVEHAFQDAQLKELYSKAVANIAKAREDNSRSESNLGLYEERLSMIERNRSLSIREKVDALTKLMETLTIFDDREVSQGMQQLENEKERLRTEEEIEKQDVERRTQANNFLQEILKQMPAQNFAGQGVE
jgi:hypothetical protein